MIDFSFNFFPSRQFVVVAIGLSLVSSKTVDDDDDDDEGDEDDEYDDEHSVATTKNYKSEIKMIFCEIVQAATSAKCQTGFESKDRN